MFLSCLSRGLSTIEVHNEILRERDYFEMSDLDNPVKNPSFNVVKYRSRKYRAINSYSQVDAQKVASDFGAFTKEMMAISTHTCREVLFLDTTNFLVDGTKLSTIVMKIPTGVFPLAMLLHKRETIATFSLFLEKFKMFYSVDWPIIWVTDHSQALLSSTKAIFPESKNWICTWHSNRTIKRNLRKSSTNEKETERLATLALSSTDVNVAQDAIKQLEDLHRIHQDDKGLATIVNRLHRWSQEILLCYRDMTRYGDRATNNRYFYPIA
ncbi:hypothetical protein Ciccas_001301 [Cichlidogyrus casuarinus]|uniref:MULE transposase domain-containing protein n=1 Tax=Cichlidogyrus casuarinus TaxID=1844966 RepID=A0ABD2QKY9_9PLAT